MSTDRIQVSALPQPGPDGCSITVTAMRGDRCVEHASEPWHLTSTVPSMLTPLDNLARQQICFTAEEMSRTHGLPVMFDRLSRALIAPRIRIRGAAAAVSILRSLLPGPRALFRATAFLAAAGVLYAGTGLAGPVATLLAVYCLFIALNQIVATGIIAAIDEAFRILAPHLGLRADDARDQGTP